MIVDVIFPCLNEAGALPWILDRMPAGFRPIVVDNCSTDGSGDIARSLGAMVVPEQVRGFGAAAHAGLLAATSDLVCFCDCDGSLDPRQLPLLTAPLRRGAAAEDQVGLAGQQRCGQQRKLPRVQAAVAVAEAHQVGSRRQQACVSRGPEASDLLGHDRRAERPRDIARPVR